MLSSTRVVCSLLLLLSVPLCPPAQAEGFEELFARLPQAASDAEPEGLSSILTDSRLAKILETEAKRPRRGSTEKVLSPTCVTAPTFSDFFELKDLEPDAGARNRIPVPDGLSLDQPAQSLSDVFKIIKTTEVGSAILKKFLPKFGFDIKVENFAARSVASRTTAGLAALYDSGKRTIYINKREQIGQLAFVLLHEIVHSLDGDFVKSVDTELALGKQYAREVTHVLEETAERLGKPKTALERFDVAPTDFEHLVTIRRELQEFRDLRMFRAERFAYDASYRVWLELDRQFPGYYQAGIRGRSGKPVPYDDAWLIKVLRLNPDTIARYQRGLCRTQALGLLPRQPADT